jgi:hypothetical protein
MTKSSRFGMNSSEIIYGIIIFNLSLSFGLVLSFILYALYSLGKESEDWTNFRHP